MQWSPPLSGKTVNPKKPARVGIKFFVLACGKDGYVLNFRLSHRDSELPRSAALGSTASVVLELLDGDGHPTEGFDSWNKFHRIFVDSYYTSANLFRRCYLGYFSDPMWWR